MKRHEYRDFNFWKKLDETDFAIISTVNNQALSVLINKMRGDRTLEKYAYECDVAISTLYRCINGERKRPYHYDILLALYQGKSPECEIGFEYLLAANGMMLVEDIAKQRDKLLKKAGIKTTKGKDKKRERLEKDQKKACRKLGTLIKEMKGNRSYAEYAFDCLLPKGTIIYIVNLGRKTPLTEAQLRLLYEHRYPGCSVTLKQLQKANAMFPKDKRQIRDTEVEVALATVEPYDLRENKKEPEVITYDDFLEDLSFYLMKKTEQVVPEIRKKSKDLYKDVKIRDMLHKFRIESKYEWDLRIEEVRNFFENKGLLSQPERKGPVYLEKKLDKLLIV